jgi:hypothetical protein
MGRLTNYASVSGALARLSEEELTRRLANAPSLHAGVGGRSVLLTIDSTPIFVKQIPLTDLERQQERVRSTVNIFDIPLACHYGFGGPGFSAWRELAATVIANGWVLSGACEDFPLLYHWRVLPSDHPQELTGDVSFWSDSAAVRARLDAVNNATARLVLCCEYLPRNLLDWLGEQLRVGEDAAETAIAFVDAHLMPTIDFMNAHGLTHFDAHFENIVTDGWRFCFADFGLALSSDFELTGDEAAFLTRHRRYDRGRAAVAYAHCLSTTFFGREQWKENLRLFLESPHVPPAAAEALRQHTPLALGFLEFARRLREDKQTPYPSEL